MLKVGLNPYGLTYYLGLQGAGTPRAYPAGRGLDGFFEIGLQLKAECLEIHAPWLFSLPPQQLAAWRDKLANSGMVPVVSLGPPMERVDEAIRCAAAIGAKVLRLGLSPVLHGARAKEPRWQQMVAYARHTLKSEGPLAQELGITFAIEDHQDFGSEELVAFCEEAGQHCGICIDTGNALAVAEDPVAFARRVAPWVKHVHLKDYRAQWTAEGYRLVRCAIGDGCVPFSEIFAVLLAAQPSLTASLEPGALEVRHIRLFMEDWWQGYADRPSREMAPALAVARRRRLADDADYRTPWEADAPAEQIVQYELAMIERSMQLVQAMNLDKAKGESQ